jgi:SPX domain protein involved in polyphosphate accumulation
VYANKGAQMKFSKYLESQSVPEWRKAYINYKGLKQKLKQVERVSIDILSSRKSYKS